MEAPVVLPRRLPIANVDLVILFGNLMDNAVEACGQVASPFIRLEAGLRKDYLVVTETNPAPADDHPGRSAAFPSWSGASACTF